MSELRRAVFLIFTVIYLIIAPLTVLYALGYIVSPSHQTLLQTGLVSLDSEPARAVVSLNGSLTSGKTPLVLQQLKPGGYDIQIRLPGRHLWQKHLEIKPNLALRFENILLFPLKFEPEVLTDFPVAKMWHVLGGRYLVALSQAGASGFYLLDLDEKKPKPVYAALGGPAETIEQLHLHPKGDRAIVALRKEKSLRLVYVKFEEPGEVKELGSLLQEPVNHLTWDRNQKDLLFYLQGDTLGRIHLEKGLVDPSPAKGVKSFGLYNDRIFALDEKNRFLELTEKGKLVNVLLDNPTKARLIFGGQNQETFSIFFLPSELLFFPFGHPLALFLSEKGRLFSNRLPYFLDEGVSELALGVSHRRIAYRKGNELWVVDFEREREKSFFESGPTPRKIYEGKEALGNLFWFYKDQYLLFSEGNRVLVQDFEEGGNAIELLEISKVMKKVMLDSKEGFLYFVPPDQGRLVRVKLYEKESLLPHAMAELVSSNQNHNS